MPRLYTWLGAVVPGARRLPREAGVSRMSETVEPQPADSPNGRSGCCYEETFPRMHQMCPGTYGYRPTPTASPEIRRCSCRCHIEGVEALGVPTMRKLLEDLSGGEQVRGGRHRPRVARI